MRRFLGGRGNPKRRRRNVVEAERRYRIRRAVRAGFFAAAPAPNPTDPAIPADGDGRDRLPAPPRTPLPGVPTSRRELARPHAMTRISDLRLRDPLVEQARQKLVAGERLSQEDGLRLFDAPVMELGRLADAFARDRHR